MTLISTNQYEQRRATGRNSAKVGRSPDGGYKARAMNVSNHFKTICCLGLPKQAAMVAIAAALHDLIPSEWNKIGFLIDGPGLGAGYAEHPDCVTLAASHSTLLKADQWFAAYFGASFALPGTTGWLGLREPTRYQNCSVFDVIEKPLDSHWVLDATFHDGRRTFAGLMLTRPRTMKPFGPDDAARLEALRPWITHALRDRDGDADQDGLLVGHPRLSTHALMRATVIVDASARLLVQSSGAGYLFALLDGMSTAIEPARRVASDAIPSVVRRVIGRVANAVERNGGRPPRLQVPTVWGVVTIEASWLAPPGIDVAAFAADPLDGRIAVSMELREAPAAHAARVLRASGATPTQVQVGILLALGKQKPEIARQLGVRPTSIEDATRKLYLRLQIHSVAELCALLWLSEPGSWTPRRG